LSVTAKGEGQHSRLALAYKAKGISGVESLLCARYLMYGSVYWHHTFSCIQAMFAYAVWSTFGAIRPVSAEGNRKPHSTRDDTTIVL